jgi:nitroreductase
MVRAFTEEPLEPGTAERLLRAANRAPSAGFSQGYSFLVLESEEQRARAEALDRTDAPRPLVTSQRPRGEGASRPRARACSTASWRRCTPSLSYRWRMWVLTVFTDKYNSSAISGAESLVGR